MTVKAIYMGEKNDGSFWVNVKPKTAKGLLGDAGLIRQFKSKKEAEEYINIVNKTGEDFFQKNDIKIQKENVIHQGDSFIKENK